MTVWMRRSWRWNRIAEMKGSLCVSRPDSGKSMILFFFFFLTKVVL